MPATSRSAICRSRTAREMKSSVLLSLLFIVWRATTFSVTFAPRDSTISTTQGIRRSEELLTAGAQNQGAQLSTLNKAHRDEGIEFRKYYRSLRVLTSEEEMILGRFISMGKVAVAQITANRFSSSAEDHQSPKSPSINSSILLSAVARQLLVAHNIRFVDSWTRAVMQSSPAGREVSYYELLVQGILGLGKAAERFDSTKGYRFLTYAKPWVIRELLHGLTTLRAGAFLSPQNVDVTIRAHKARTRLTTELLRLPTEQEVAAAINISLPRLRSLEFDSRTKRTIISAHSEMAKAGHSLLGGRRQTYLDVLSSQLPGVLESALLASCARVEANSSLQKLMSDILTPLEMRTVCIRYGLLGRAGRQRSTEATAELMCMTVEGVRRVLLRAQEKLRKEGAHFAADLGFPLGAGEWDTAT